MGWTVQCLGRGPSLLISNLCMPDQESVFDLDSHPLFSFHTHIYERLLLVGCQMVCQSILEEVLWLDGFEIVVYECMSWLEGGATL